MLQTALEYNKVFVRIEGYRPFLTNKYPDKKLAILTCMDTRLVELLPAALGIKNGDVKILKNAGGIVSHPYGSVMRSLIIAIYQLGVEMIWVIGHTDCGMEHSDTTALLQKMTARGIAPGVIEQVREDGVDFEHWLGGFSDVCEAIQTTMQEIRRHPLIPADIQIEGMLMDSATGEITQIESL
ncbi:MAG: carbonic anhydrase [Bacteroidales bacterium]